ncbi:MAG: endonuclease/exonuclease/phosphatase family protein [Elusimicrobiota bacterium]
MTKSQTTSSAPFSGKLRILTYNICHCRGSDSNAGKVIGPRLVDARLTGIAELIQREAPDIVVLNEVDFESTWTGRKNQAAALFDTAGLSYGAEQMNIDIRIPFLYTERFGNVVMSRYPIEEASLVRLPAHHRWEALVAGHANAMLCRVQIPGFGPIHLFATHLESRSEAIRVQSVERIEDIRRSSKLPFILAGDLNSSPTGFPTSQQAHGKNALTILLSGEGYITLPRQSPAESDYTGVYTGKPAVIDWILVPPDWTILSRRVIQADWSDHRPVVMDVALPSPQ